MNAATTSPNTEHDLEQQPAAAPQAAPEAETGSGRVYRGRTVAELIPKIQADFGSEAVVTGRRSGLEGGIAGFFQRPFVEIQAQPGAPRVDLCDGDEALPPLTYGLQAGSADPFANTTTPLTSQLESFAGESFVPDGLAAGNGNHSGDGFADALAAAGAGLDTDQTEGPLPLAGTAAAGAVNSQALVAANGSLANPTQNVHALAAQAAPEAVRSRAEAALAAELERAGFDTDFVSRILATASSHVLAFAPRLGLRRAARVALERHLPQAAPMPPAGGVVVLVGPGGAGKTKCVGAMGDCYRRSGALAVAAGELGAGEAGAPQMLLAPHVATPVDFASRQAQSALTVARSQGLALLDTPAVSPADAGGIRALAKVLSALAAERVIVALPATLSASAAGRLLEAMKPLKPNAIAITHVDESEELGVAVQAACAFGLAPEYLLSVAKGQRALTRVEPSTLADRLLP